MCLQPGASVVCGICDSSFFSSVLFVCVSPFHYIIIIFMTIIIVLAIIILGRPLLTCHRRLGSHEHAKRHSISSTEFLSITFSRGPNINLLFFMCSFRSVCAFLFDNISFLVCYFFFVSIGHHKHCVCLKHMLACICRRWKCSLFFLSFDVYICHFMVSHSFSLTHFFHSLPSSSPILCPSPLLWRSEM